MFDLIFIVVLVFLMTSNYVIVVHHSFNNDWRKLRDAPLMNIAAGIFSTLVLMAILDKFF